MNPEWGDSWFLVDFRGDFGIFSCSFVAAFVLWLPFQGGFGCYHSANAFLLNLLHLSTNYCTVVSEYIYPENVPIV